LKEGTQKKSEPCGCLTACLEGLRGLGSYDATRRGAKGSGENDGEIYSEPQPLEELQAARAWEELSEQERGKVAVVLASAAKEDCEGWQNQDAYIACAPVPLVQESGGADDPWESYDAYIDKGPAASETAAQGGSDAVAGAAPHLLFGVLDGHGRQGHTVSALAAKRVPGHLMTEPGFAADPGKALANAVRKADRDVYKQMARAVEYNGTTAVMVCVDTRQKCLYCANVGDSRAVLGRLDEDAKDPRWETVPLTVDTKPDLPDEKERIEMSGGVVAPARVDGEFVGPPRVWEDWSLTKPGLAMGRSIGDGCGRQIGIVAEPVLSRHKLRPNDRFVLMASDGLWDALSNEDAVAIAAKHLQTPEAAPAALIEAARQKQEGQLEDDTTVVMVVFKA